MKKNLLLTVAICCVITSFSQINKGQIITGGNITFATAKQDEIKTTKIQLSPGIGFFFIDNFAGGLKVDLQSEKQSFDDEEVKVSTYAITPFIKYYFLPAAQKVNIFAQAGYSFGGVTVDNGFADQSLDMNGISIGAGPAIFLSPSTSLEFTIGYSSVKIEDVSERLNTIALGIGFQIHLGKSK